MTYRFTGKNKDGVAVEPLPGLPLEASDRDFNEALREYAAFTGDEDAPAAVKASGLYEHVNEAATTPARKE